MTPNPNQVRIRNDSLLLVLEIIDNAFEDRSSELRPTDIGYRSGDQIRGTEKVRLNAAPECDVRPDHPRAYDVSDDLFVLVPELKNDLVCLSLLSRTC
jgi:hypothetical protein